MQRALTPAFRRRRRARRLSEYTLTVNSTAADGFLGSSNAAYATARAGSGLTVDTTRVDVVAGQLAGGTHDIYYSYLDFDTSSIPVGAEIISAPLTLTIHGGGTAINGKIFQARLYDWGSGLTTADWVPGADLAAKTLLATYTSDGAVSGVVTFADVAMAANINKGGITRFLICSKDTVDNIAATTAQEFIQFKSADEVGTATDPKLVVTYLA